MKILECQRPKTPEGWRSPRRFAKDEASLKIPAGFGVRWPSTAFRPGSGVLLLRAAD